MTQVSSRERMLGAMSHQTLDHIPLWFNWHYKHTQLLTWSDPVERAEKVLDMGLDDSVLISVPWGIAPEVSMKTWVTHPVGSRYPLIHKEWYTPKGTLSQTVQKTDDWDELVGSGTQDLSLATDLNVPRSLEFPLKGPEDIAKLAYLHRPPSQEQWARFRDNVARAQALDRRKGVLIEGGWIPLGDEPFWLLGAQGLALAQYDRPELLEEFLQEWTRWNTVRIDMLLDAGVHVITQRAWYESTDFWGVQGWRRFLKPLLRSWVERVHAAGRKFSYILTTGLKARANDLSEVGIDTLWGVDPVQDSTVDLPYLKRQIGDRVCLLGGVNAQVTLVEGSEEDIRREVRYACETLGPGGGFILAPIDNIYEYTPRRNLETLIDEWKKLRDDQARV